MALEKTVHHHNNPNLFRFRYETLLNNGKTCWREKQDRKIEGVQRTLAKTKAIHVLFVIQIIGPSPLIGSVQLIESHSDTSSPLKTAFSEWKSKLLQLDRRNRLLYFRTHTDGGKPNTGVVHIACEDLDHFYSSLIESADGLKFPYAEKKRKRSSEDATDGHQNPEPTGEPESDLHLREGDISVLDCSLLDLQRRLRVLRKRDKEYEQEQGINVLFIAFGFLRWVDEQEKEGFAPLLLLPCDLETESLKDNVRLVQESDDLLINVTLKQKLSTLKFSLPDFDTEVDTISSYLAKCESALCRESDWTISKDVFLSTFAYSKIAMWEDLERMSVSGFKTPILQALSGAEIALRSETLKSSITESIDDGDFIGAKLDDELDASRQFLVLPADYSQILAIEAARSGCDLIIHGPPGTGKSQTIANLIGALMADGKTVLFVSEKSAALDVVKRRLEQRGLGQFCLDLHGRRAKKEFFYEQLRQSVDDDRQLTDSKFPYQQLDEQRTQLNELARALHRMREPLNTSVYKMHGEYAKVRDELDVQFEIGNDAYLPHKLDANHYRKLLEIAERLSKREDQFRHHFDAKWKPLKTTPTTVRLSDDLRTSLRAAITSMDNLAERLHDSFLELGLDQPVSLGSAKQLPDFYRVMVKCPSVPPTWLSAGAVTRLRRLAEEKRQDYQLLSELKTEVSKYFENDLPEVDFQASKSSLDHLRKQEKHLSSVLGESWSKRLLVESDQLHQTMKKLSSIRSSLVNMTDEITSLLGAPPASNRQEIEKIIELANKVLALEKTPEIWFETQNHRDVERALQSGRRIHDELKIEETSLFEEYNQEILSKIDKQMRARFITDYDGFLGKLLKRNQYVSDIKSIHIEHKQARKPTKDDALLVINKTLNVKKLREDWQELDEALKKQLDHLYQERDTDWNSAWELFKNTKELLSAHIDPMKVKTLTKDPQQQHSLRTTVAALQTILKDLDEQLNLLTGDASCLKFDSELTALGQALDLAKPAISDASSLAVSWSMSDRTELTLEKAYIISNQCCSLKDIQQRLNGQKELLKSEFGTRFNEEYTDWSETTSALDWVDSLLKEQSLPISATLEKEIENPKDRHFYATNENHIRQGIEKVEQAFSKLDGLFEIRETKWTSWATAPFDELRKWAEPLINDADEAPEWIIYRQACQELNKELGSDVIQDLRSEIEESFRITNIIKRRLVRDWLDHIYSTEPLLQSFAVQDQEDLIEKFRKLDKEIWPDAAVDEIRRRIYSQYPSRQAFGEVGSEMPKLRSELSKKRGRLPIRKLIDRMPQLIKSLKPCFLMSPLSVSQHLPQITADDAPPYDVLIFDEASQIFPEDAVPAIARAQQLVVVGDEKQLPPTNFFRNSEDTSWEDESAYDNEDENALTDTESILSAMKRFIGRGVYERYLKVHYRSKHDTLIKFSNHHFYDKKLLIFPSPSRDIGQIGLRDIFVPDGRFDSGGTRTNRLEAERVVDLVFEHMRTTSESQSLAVVTLSVAQAELINELVNNRKQKEPDIAFRFREDQPEEFFVKNLEKVQGDEREHIILCVGYGPTVGSGKTVNRFGPINSPSGPRRLNVATTRARSKLTLVRSLNASDITSEAPGARLLRQFIEYAQDPMRHFESQISLSPDSEPESSFEVAVKNALEAKGLKVQPQVGVSGYRIDLAILSDDSMSYDLGIECDGACYHSSPAARDRDWLRQQILEGLGWTIHRIWSTSWIRNPQMELTRIEEALYAARQRRSSPTSPNQ